MDVVQTLSNIPNLIATTCLVLILIQALSMVMRQSHLKQIRTPPGAKWIWGHEQTVFMNQPGHAFRNWIKDLGLTFRIKAAFGAPDVLVLGDPEGIGHILQKKIYDYHHSKLVRPRVARLLGKGLGWIEGEDEHKRMRKMASPSFSSENIKSMTSDIRDSASTVINELVQHVETNGRTLSVNILHWASKATLNVIGRVIFLHDFEGGNSEDAKQIIKGRIQGVSQIARYAGFLTLMLLRRFPILNNLPIKAIQAQGYGKMAVQSGVAREMVKRNQELVTESSEKNGKDLLSRLLIAEAEGRISTAELYEQISTFVISGHETTTQTLSFTMWELARHPDVQQKLREEIVAFSGEPTYDDYQTRLPYLDAVARETLRLYPGLAYIERVATKDDVIPLGEPAKLRNGQTTNNIPVHIGQTVLIPVISIQRLDSIWEHPDDFRPERWLGTLPPLEKLPSGWSNTLAFSEGPRSCIGVRLGKQCMTMLDALDQLLPPQAIFQYKVLLTTLVRLFRFHDTGAEISLKISSSLQPWVVGPGETGARLPLILELI